MRYYFAFFGFFWVLPVLSIAKEKLTPVVMQLDWVYNAQFAGIYQADAQGYYGDAGFKVDIRKADPNQKTVDAVLAEEGLVFGSAESNIIMRAYIEGAPFRVVGAMFQANPMGWMYLKSSGITTIKDLEGRSVGIHPDGEKILALVGAKNGLNLANFTLPTINYSLDVLIDGEIDAMQCYVIDEFVRLQLKTNNQAGVLLAKDYGYDTYSQVFFTTAEIVNQKPDKVRAFLEASRQGWIYAMDNMEETVALIHERYGTEFSADYLLASMKEIEKLVRPNGTVMNPVDPEVWNNMQSLYLKHGVLDKGADLDKLLSFKE